MGSMNVALLALATVAKFRGYAVIHGAVQVTEQELEAHLNATYSEVTICGLNVKPGGALRQLSPGIFNAIMVEYKEELQHSLQGQLAASNDVDIDWRE